MWPPPRPKRKLSPRSDLISIASALALLQTSPPPPSPVRPPFGMHTNGLVDRRDFQKIGRRVAKPLDTALISHSSPSSTQSTTLLPAHTLCHLSTRLMH